MRGDLKNTLRDHLNQELSLQTRRERFQTPFWQHSKCWKVSQLPYLKPLFANSKKPHTPRKTSSFRFFLWIHVVILWYLCRWIDLIKKVCQITHLTVLLTATKQCRVHTPVSADSGTVAWPKGVYCLNINWLCRYSAGLTHTHSAIGTHLYKAILILTGAVPTHIISATTPRTYAWINIWQCRMQHC